MSKGDELKSAPLTIVKQSDLLRCPNVIIDPWTPHHQSDGKCLCFDPEYDDMAEWGYVWSDEKMHWIPGPDEEE